MSSETSQKLDVWALICGLSAIALFVAVMIFGASFFMFQTAQHCKKPPSEISARDLADKGPPADNWYVRVTDYRFDKAETATKGFTIETLWCDVIPTTGVGEPTNSIRLTNRCVNSDAEVQKFLNEKAFEGIASPPGNHQVKVDVGGFPQVELISKGMLGGAIAALVLLALTIFSSRLAKRSNADGFRSKPLR